MNSKPAIPLAVAGSLAGIVCSPVVAAVVTALGILLFYLLLLIFGFLISLPVLFYVIAIIVGLLAAADVLVTFYLTYAAVGFVSAKAAERVMRGSGGGLASISAMASAALSVPLYMLLLQRLLPLSPLGDMGDYLQKLVGTGFPGISSFDWTWWAWGNLVAGIAIAVFAAKEEAGIQVATSG
jgi:hypothetical protein